MKSLKKRILGKCLVLLFVPIVFLGAGACSGGNSYIPSDYVPPFSYGFISENRNFIGGSLIYDPDSSNGLTQIYAGAKFGVRLGKLSEKSLEVKSYASGSTVESSASDDTVSGENDDPNSKVTLTTSLKDGTAKFMTVYEDVPDKAVYGYISIENVSSESISFSFTTVTPLGAVGSKSFTIKKGESCDLDGNGKKNLKYDEPSLKRNGYSEKARWLTFLNDEKTLTSNMFCKFSASEAQAGYRLPENASASVVDKGLYAVNSNDDFVYVYYDNYETDRSMAYGDYIVCLPSTMGVNENNIEWGNEYDNPGDDDESTTDKNEFYDNVAAMNTSDTTMNFGGKTYIVTRGSTSAVELKDKNEFENYSIEYSYQLWHFPDETKGPSDLLGDLNASSDALKSLINLPDSSSAEEIIPKLNVLLQEEDFFNAVLDAKVSDATKKSEAKSSYAAAGSPDEKTRLCRLLVDEFYPSSPDALIEGPDLTRVYPDMVFNLGSPEELSDFMYQSQRNMYVDEIAADNAKKIHSKYSDYKKRHDELAKEWKRFFSIDISQVVLYPYDKSKTKKFNPQSAGVYLGAGLRASASVTKGRADFEVALAFWLDLDLNMQSLNVILDYTLNPALAKKMEGPNISLAEKLMAVFQNKDVRRIEVKLNDVNINVGGVPLVFGVTAKTGINFKLEGAFDPRICFSGMYGGELKLGASYGVEWFAKPYFRPYADAKGINNTDFYIGLGDKGASNTKITFEPWFCLTPSFGLGTSAISVRGSVPTKFGLHTVMSVPPIKMVEAGVFISVWFSPYFEADLKFFKIKKVFKNFKPLDHDILFYPLPVKTRRRPD